MLWVALRFPLLPQATLEAIGAWACQFTPKVSLEPPQALLLEVEGSLRLFGGLPFLKQKLQSGLEAMGFDAGLAFLVQEDQSEAPDARLSGGEQAFELHQEPPRGEREPLGMDDRRRQLEPRAEARRRLEEGAQLGQRAARVIDLVEEFPAAALREPLSG